MTLPSDSSAPTRFDRFADKINSFTSKAWFFAGCVLLVLLWIPSYWLVGDLDTWQLLINTPTTVITFLLVALATNSSARDRLAMHSKSNAVAEGVADILDQLDEGESRELRQAVGLEDRQSSSDT